MAQTLDMTILLKLNKEGAAPSLGKDKFIS